MSRARTAAAGARAGGCRARLRCGFFVLLAVALSGAASAQGAGTAPPPGRSAAAARSGAPIVIIVDDDRGDFVAKYVPPETPDYAVYHEQLRAQRFLESVTDELNLALELPADVTLRLAECGHSTTLWARDTRAVTVCYEFLDAVIAIAGEQTESRERAEQLFSGAVTFALFAEVGRALVSIYDLPVHGSTLAAGDEFAAISLAASDGAGDRAAAAAVEFYEHALRTPDSGFEWLETHRFDRGRLADVACLLYGKSPHSHPGSVSLGLVESGDAPACARRLASAAQHWDAMLRDYTKPPVPR